MSNLARDLRSEENRNIVQTGKPVDYFGFLEEIEGKYVHFYDAAAKTFNSDKNIKKLEDLDIIGTWHTERDYMLKNIGVCRILWTLQHEESIIIDPMVNRSDDLNQLESFFDINYDLNDLGEIVIKKIKECGWAVFNNIIRNIKKSGYLVYDTENEYIKSLKETGDFIIYLAYEAGVGYIRIHLVASSKQCEDKDLETEIM